MLRRVVCLVLLLGLLASGCQANWLSARFGASNTGFNSAEQVLDRNKVLGLHLAIDVEVGPLAARWAVPVVRAGLVYVATTNALEVYRDQPSASCTPSSACPPVWTASLDGYPASSPAIAGNVVYVQTTTRLYAFDAAGTGTGCTGTPVVCLPLWTAPHEGLAPPAVQNGLVYAVGTNALSVFDAAGTQGCAGTPKICAPRWSTVPTAAAFGPMSSPSVNGDAAFMIDIAGRVFAYGATAGASCTGVPLVCPPRWTAFVGGGFATTASGWPGTVLAGTRLLTYSKINAGALAQVSSFDATGVQGCSGAPKVCTPQWSTGVPGFPLDAQLAVADGSVYVITTATNPGYATSAIYAYAVDGAGCTGTPMTCPPQWHSGSILAGAFAFPVIANGLLYQQTGGANLLTIAVYETHPAPGSCLPTGCGATAAVGGTFDGTARVSIVGGAVYILVADRPSGIGRLVIYR